MLFGGDGEVIEEPASLCDVTEVSFFRRHVEAGFAIEQAAVRDFDPPALGTDQAGDGPQGE